MTSRKNVEIPSIGDSKKAVFDPTGGYCKRGLVAHRRVTPRFSGMVIDPFWVCLKTGHTVPPNGKFNLARNANLINRVVFIVFFLFFAIFGSQTLVGLLRISGNLCIPTCETGVEIHL